MNALVCEGDDARKAALRAQTSLNGIDWVEVDASQLTLRVHFVNPLPANAYGLDLDPSRITVRGGVRVRNVKVVQVVHQPDHLRVDVDRIGDFSTYTLAIDEPALDPLFAACDFSFKAGCPTRFDCRGSVTCPPPTVVEPRIDYMAKDYASFRQALVDLLPVWIPGWKEQHEADLAITLVELFAHAGDLLSYHQDSVANESFLATARRRISVRRHARLVDYAMHDGASARTFVQLEVTAPVTLPADTAVVSRVREGTAAIDPLAPTTPRILREVDVWYRTREALACEPELNRLEIHGWGRADCCLPKGATDVFFLGPLPTLKVGAYLVFEEIVSPTTGLAADADVTHRQAVRVTDVAVTSDPLLGVPLVHVKWDEDDALAQPFCISSSIADGDATITVPNVTIARGNVVLGEHGRAVREERRPPGVAISPTALPHPGPLVHADAFLLALSDGPLGQSIPSPPGASVAALMQTDLTLAMPSIAVSLGQPSATYTPTRDLLSSGRFDREFVAEIDDRERAILRFGDGTYGEKPSDFSRYDLTYLVGVGTGGNVGADSLAHVLFASGAIGRVRNPLPAWGGIDPEATAHVKESAPVAFRRRLERAVTEADYAALAGRIRGVARAVATFRWTGSWYTVFVSIDRVGGLEVDDAFREMVRTALDRYRIAGCDLEVSGPIHVPLELELDICVAPDHFRSDVEAAVLEALSSRTPTGFFHPDRFTFGQSLYVSDLYAAVMSVDGVAGANILRLHRWGKADAGDLARGFLPAGRLEILRLDDDPNAQENGVLTLHLGGGK